MMLRAIRIEGGLFSPDILERLPEIQGQKPTDFGVPRSRALTDEISSVWRDAQVYWNGFQRRLERLRATKRGESLTTITREHWVIPLLEALGYEPTYQQRAEEVDGRTYAISHRAGPGNEPPIHIVAFDQELGERPVRGRGSLSPHTLLQEYLNQTDHLWGIVTNGRSLRLLRDSTYFTRPSYIEFDLESIFRGEQFSEFVLFYRLVHRSRLPKGVEDVSTCLLERYHQDAIDQGSRIRDGLRDAVEQALIVLANGFLHHKANGELRGAVEEGSLTPRDLYRELLRLIYRLLFLMVAEERHLLVNPSSQAGSSQAYLATFYEEHFSVSRLRRLADADLTGPERFDDLYLSLRTLFATLRNPDLAARLGLPPLNGELFEELRYLDNSRISNADFLKALRHISYFTPQDEKVERRINYAALDVEELGSVYESLLDLEPRFGEEGGRLKFYFAEGTERKSTGSYYTPPQLVRELIESALVPVMEERLAGAKTDRDKVNALLSIRICDPACGSGHFLLAAARRLGRGIASIETHSDEPPPEAVR
ncbi:MAG: restriction endonuclease, partial [Methanobacteriota archaeon]